MFMHTKRKEFIRERGSSLSRKWVPQVSQRPTKLFSAHQQKKFFLKVDRAILYFIYLIDRAIITFKKVKRITFRQLLADRPDISACRQVSNIFFLKRKIEASASTSKVVTKGETDEKYWEKY